MKLHHGGNIHAAAEQYGIAQSQWIDISTGISPWSWPVPELPSEVLRRLPFEDRLLERAAAQFYGCNEDAVLAVPGSQFALQHLPGFLSAGRVAMPLRGYAEHRLAWGTAGHTIVNYRDAAELQVLVSSAAVDHVLLINPNNPTGETIGRETIEKLHTLVEARGGYLVIDEAFADACPQVSYAHECPKPGLVVFRSLGKFFGLAGIRLGFMLAPVRVRNAVSSILSPWMVSHPARWIGERALGDVDWQLRQRQRLQQASLRWNSILERLLPQFCFTHNSLFVSAIAEPLACDTLYDGLAKQGILIRQFEVIDHGSMLRFGLPADHELGSIESAIQTVVQSAVSLKMQERI